MTQASDVNAEKKYAKSLYFLPQIQRVKNSTYNSPMH